MPELPEVQTVVNALAPRVCGHVIHYVWLHRTDILTPPTLDLPAMLVGGRVRSITRRGKRIVFQLNSGQRFYVHLGMTGHLSLCPPDTPSKTHTHLVVGLGDLEMRFTDPRRFGGVWWLGTEVGDGSLGPEPLSLRAGELFRRLSGTRRAVKTALLDQRVIAGVGNIYADESLHRAGIDPRTPACRLSREQAGVLCRAIRWVLRQAIRHGGSTIIDYRNPAGGTGRFQDRHRVYDRAGEPCRSCRTPIRRIVLQGRSTHFCPACQKRRRSRKQTLA